MEIVIALILIVFGVATVFMYQVNLKNTRYVSFRKIGVTKEFLFESLTKIKERNEEFKKEFKEDSFVTTLLNKLDSYYDTELIDPERLVLFNNEVYKLINDNLFKIKDYVEIKEVYTQILFTDITEEINNEKLDYNKSANYINDKLHFSFVSLIAHLFGIKLLPMFMDLVVVEKKEVVDNNLYSTNFKINQETVKSPQVDNAKKTDLATVHKVTGGLKEEKVNPELLKEKKETN